MGKVHAMQDELPPIDELVGLLAIRGERDLQSLRDRFPEHRKLLEPGILAGPKPEIDIAELLVRIATAEAGMKLAIDLCERNLKDLRARLRTARNLQITGKVMSVVGGAAIFTTLSQHYVTATYVAAVFTMIGSLLPEISQFFSAPLHVDAPGTFDTLRQLVGYQSEAESLASEFGVYQRIGGVRAGNMQMVVERIGLANELASKVRKLAGLV